MTEKLKLGSGVAVGVGGVVGVDVGWRVGVNDGAGVGEDFGGSVAAAGAQALNKNRIRMAIPINRFITVNITK